MVGPKARAGFPAPPLTGPLNSTPAAKAKEERDRAKGKLPAAEVAAAQQAVAVEDNPQPPRQQPQRQTKAQRQAKSPVKSPGGKNKKKKR